MLCCDLPLVSMAKCSSMVRPWSSKLARCQAPINYIGSEVSKSTEELEYRTSLQIIMGEILKLMPLFNLRDVSLMVTNICHSDCTEGLHRYLDLPHWPCRV